MRFKETSMTKKRLALMISMVLVLTAVVNGATDGMGPLETLQGTVNQFLEVLNDPDYVQLKSRTVQRDKIWEIASTIFDLREISRRAIGKPWLKFSAEEQDRFTAVFTRFLGNTYIDKLQGEYKDVKVDFNRVLIKGSRAMVRTKLIRESLDVPIDYRMRNIDGAWRVYDVLIENGVSLVKNYRVQFSSILKKETPGQLIKRLEEKLASRQINAPQTQK